MQDIDEAFNFVIYLIFSVENQHRSPVFLCAL